MVSVRGRDRRRQAGPRSSSDGRGRGRRLAAIAVIVLVSGLVLFGLDPFGLVGDAQQPGGGQRRRRALGLRPAPSGSAVDRDPENQAPAPPPIPGHEVYGFVPYWEMDAGIAKHLAKTDLSTLALFSVTHRSSGRMQDNQTGYRRITGDLGQQLIRQAHKRGTRVEVVYTSFGEAKNRKFYGSDKAQSRWIKELVDFAEEQGLDGINVDVELLPDRPRPGIRGMGRAPARRRSANGCPMPRSPSQPRAGYAARRWRPLRTLPGRIASSSWATTTTGPARSQAPRRRWTGSMARTTTSRGRWTVTPTLGVPAEKTILGLPLYGYTWPVSGPGIGAPSLGRGDTWVPRRNLRVFEDESFDPEYNATESVEFYSVPDEEHGSWDAVYYDSPRSLTPKLALANERGLAGAGFWAIGYERGLPGYTKLIKSFRAGEAAGRQARGVGPYGLLLAGRAARLERPPFAGRGRPRCSLGEHAPRQARGSATGRPADASSQAETSPRSRTPVITERPPTSTPPRTRVPGQDQAWTRSLEVAFARLFRFVGSISRVAQDEGVRRGRANSAEIRPVGPDHPAYQR